MKRHERIQNLCEQIAGDANFLTSVATDLAEIRGETPTSRVVAMRRSEVMDLLAAIVASSKRDMRSMLYVKSCPDCGEVFRGAHSAQRCRECSIERRRARDRQYRSNRKRRILRGEQ